MNASTSPDGLFVRLVERSAPAIRFTIDGRAAEAVLGDLLMSAILLNRRALRQFEFGADARAGFCFMGACQDCWVTLEGGRRVRACTTLVEEGMAILTEETERER